ncbi:MAG: hypothetical protein ACYC8T_01100 [Myxococcaceae bacterium]
MRLLLLIALVASNIAVAAPRAAFVLRIEGPDVFVDLGRADGVSAGTRLRVYRTIEGTHPLSGKKVRDRFVLGEVQVLEAGESLSRLQAASVLLEQLEVGDPVELADRLLPGALPAKEEPRPLASAPLRCPAPTALPPAVEFAPLKAAWLRALDLPPGERAEVWERYLGAHPDSELAAPIRRELSLLRTVAFEPPPPPVPLPVGPAPVHYEVSAPTHALEGDLLDLVITSSDNSVPRAAMLHWKSPRAATYQTLKMVSAGEGQLRAIIPVAEVKEPGLDYFVEIYEGEGDPRAVQGLPNAPKHVEIQSVPGRQPADTQDRSRVRLSYDFVDFNKFVGNDQYHHVEGDFLYRVRTGLHAVRVGFGSYDGAGVSKRLLDTPTLPRPVGYHYGFTEFELRVSELFAVLLKGLAGVTQEGFGVGFEGKFRIGREEGTSLLVGGAATAGIGQRGSVQLSWDAVRGWPMSIEVIATNEPIGEDLGVRFNYSVGRALTRSADLVAHIGYELRDINHYGVSAGTGLSFHW